MNALKMADKNWMPTKDEHLLAVMQVANELDKYAFAFQTEDSKGVGHLPLGKSGKFTKTIFYYFESNENNVCMVVITRKPVNQVGRKGMKVPYLLQFTAEEK